MTYSVPDAESADPSYIDYEIFLSPSFSAPDFANSLVLATNNPNDTPLDLSTPLSRVLFDIQEVDSHIHTLTSSSALPLLTHTQNQTESAQRISNELSGQIASLNESYKRLETEITGRYEAAEEVRKVSERLWRTVRLSRSVTRALQLGRQLEVQMTEVQPASASSTTTSKNREDHRAMIRASHTILDLRSLFGESASAHEGEDLSRIEAVNTLRKDLLEPLERTLRSKAQQIVREFSVASASGSTTYAQTEDTRSRNTSALSTLYLLSPLPAAKPSSKPHPVAFTPDLLLTSLQDYLRTSITTSVASLARALGTLPTLDRTLAEISSRCQNIVALELLLDGLKPPVHPHISSSSTSSTAAKPADGTPVTAPSNLLHPLLAALETSSLPSYFWRSVGSALSPRVQELVQKGGVQARTLKSNRNAVRDAVRECVLRGSRAPVGTAYAGKGAAAQQGKEDGRWEREVAVMVGAVVGPLGR
jgi:hypothetical protein